MTIKVDKDEAIRRIKAIQEQAKADPQSTIITTSHYHTAKALGDALKDIEMRAWCGAQTLADSVLMEILMQSSLV